MNILVIEDDIDIYASIEHAFKKNRNVHVLPQCNFEIKRFFELYRIDLVILDLNDSGGIIGDTEAGDKIIKEIYEHSFIPIIIFSAFAKDYDNPYREKYFISTVIKGPNGIFELKKDIKRYMPFIDKRSLISDEININISEIYRNTYEKMVKNSKIKQNQDGNSELFTRLVKRRLAVSIDSSTDDKPINAWEIYLYPCLGNEYLAGDVLRKKKSSRNDTSSYRIILSPSCDLQRQEGRKPIQGVKVACFKDVNKHFKESEIKPNRLNDSSPKQYVFFHKLEGEFPHMLCDFKELEIIKFNDLDKNFERVVSIDSPFRESLVWADIAINGRPGLPDRDFQNWLTSIKQDCFGKNHDD